MNPWIAAICVTIGLSLAYAQVKDDNGTADQCPQQIAERYCEPEDENTTSIIRRAEDGTLRCEKHTRISSADREAHLKQIWPQLVAEWKGKQ